MTSAAAVLSRVTVNVPVLLASLTVSLAIVRVGSSSSIITKSPSKVSSEITALVAEDKVITAVSVCSFSVSVKTGTSMVPVSTPAEMVKVPVVAVKSKF